MEVRVSMIQNSSVLETQNLTEQDKSQIIQIPCLISNVLQNACWMNGIGFKSSLFRLCIQEFKDSSQNFSKSDEDISSL